MGAYRYSLKSKRSRRVKWKEDGEYATCLGVPIGNELDTHEWWKKKLAEVREKAKKWTALLRCGYAGRNLVVQAMYFGRFRYWLYSMIMPPDIVAEVQQDANILWWAREPRITSKKRIRRWIKLAAARAPTSKGGLGNMSWAHHAKAFYAHWIVRYVDPTESQWKTLWDTLILQDKNGKNKFTGGRGILFDKITQADATKLRSTIPKRAAYMRECLKQHWALKYKLDPQATEGIRAESPWRTWRSPSTCFKR